MRPGLLPACSVMPAFVFCHAPLDVFDYLQLCCLVVMIRVWGGHLH